MTPIDSENALPCHWHDAQATWGPELKAHHKALATQLIREGWDEAGAAKTAAERIVADLIEEATHPLEPNRR